MSQSKNHWLRIGIFVAVIVALIVVGEVTGVRKRITYEALRHFILVSGGWGVVLYVGIFCGLELLHFPGSLLYLVAVAIWGRAWGGLLGFTTAMLSIALTFAIMRAIGGQPAIPEQNKLVSSIMTRLRAHPISTVVLLRLVSFMAPAVTFALALSPIRFSQMWLGSLIGLSVWCVTGALLFEPALHYFTH